MKPSAPKSAQKFQVLVVEDDMGRAHSLLSNLMALNMECRHAPNGALALAAFCEQMPHLVLLDVMMPGIDGYEVCTQMRAMSTVPILLMNESMSDDNVMRGLKIGADDYLVKSMNEQVLSAHVIAWLRRVYQYDREETPASPLERVRAAAANAPAANAPTSQPSPHPAAGLSSEMARTQINPPAGWLRCEGCGYMGPRAKFQQTAPADKRLFCPACHSPLRTSHAL